MEGLSPSIEAISMSLPSTVILLKLTIEELQQLFLLLPISFPIIFLPILLIAHTSSYNIQNVHIDMHQYNIKY
jgi:hypothetical protein